MELALGPPTAASAIYKPSLFIILTLKFICKLQNQELINHGLSPHYAVCHYVIRKEQRLLLKLGVLQARRGILLSMYS